MLVARECFDYRNLPREQHNNRTVVRKVRRVKAKPKFVYCVIAVVTLCLAFLLVYRNVEIASAGYDIIALRNQLQELKTENQILQCKIDEMKSLENIEYLATVKLGMEKPELTEGVEFVPVESSKFGSNGLTGIASAAEVLEEPVEEQQKRNSLVQALTSLING
ncbi:hypothetical protein [Phosphitispora sp. TUW77]|uniref:hypothetical protein n=1 Tax=Phosphitispora sp. TUW77 TaxID=3152361 RepID=UPI003AB670C5